MFGARIPGWCFQNFPKKESLGVKFERLKTKRDQMMLMMGSRVQQVEESFKNLELVASDLKAEVHKDKAKSSDARFLLVDEVWLMYSIKLILYRFFLVEYTTLVSFLFISVFLLLSES